MGDSSSLEKELVPERKGKCISIRKSWAEVQHPYKENHPGRVHLYPVPEKNRITLTTSSQTLSTLFSSDQAANISRNLNLPPTLQGSYLDMLVGKQNTSVPCPMSLENNGRGKWCQQQVHVIFHLTQPGESLWKGTSIHDIFQNTHLQYKQAR